MPAPDRAAHNRVMVSVNLSEETARRIERMVADGRATSADALVASALATYELTPRSVSLDDPEDVAFLRKELGERIAAAEAGDVRPYSREGVMEVVREMTGERWRSRSLGKPTAI